MRLAGSRRLTARRSVLLCRGIRIKDAASRQKVKDILAAEEAMGEMGMGDEEGMAIERAAGEEKKTKKKVVSKGVAKKKRGGRKTGEAKADTTTD